MAHQLAAMLMTLSDLQGHLPAGSFFKCFRTAMQHAVSEVQK